MKMRSMTVAAVVVGVLAPACGIGDDAGSTSDDVTVTPHGTAPGAGPLGTLEVEVPEGLKPVADHRTLALTLTPFHAADLLPAVNTSELIAQGSVRASAGQYCLEVVSTIGEDVSFDTVDCDVVIKGGESLKYRLSRLTIREDDVALVRSQSTLGGSVIEIGVTGSPVLRARIRPTGAADVATVSGIYTAKVAASAVSGSAVSGVIRWADVDTTVEPGKDAVLRLPREDKVARFRDVSEDSTLPDAVKGGGLNWRWQNALDTAVLAGHVDYSTFRRMHPGPALDFFAASLEHVIFELGGREQSMSLAEAGTFYVRGRRIDVTDVVETDSAGKTSTLKGTVRISPAGGYGPLAWRDADGRLVSSFETGHSVLVWSGDYTIDVHYVTHGLAKSYAETIRVP